MLEVTLSVLIDNPRQRLAHTERLYRNTPSVNFSSQKARTRSAMDESGSQEPRLQRRTLALSRNLATQLVFRPRAASWEQSTSLGRGVVCPSYRALTGNHGRKVMGNLWPCVMLQLSPCRSSPRPLGWRQRR